MKLTQTNIPDVVIIEPTVIGDQRGWFMETFSEQLFHKALADLGLPASKPFVQDNHSLSKQGILRGLHYQTKNTQGKLVRVTQGEVFDVAVDIRKKSPTFGKWVGVNLSSSNKKQLWIPEGFAHGFYVISDTAEFVYKTTDYYNPSGEISIAWDDKQLDIEWPISGLPSLSDKDKSAMLFEHYKG